MKKKKKSKFRRYIFYISNIIFISMLIICAINFARDSRAFQISKLLPEKISDTISISDNIKEIYQTLKFNNDNNEPEQDDRTAGN